MLKMDRQHIILTMLSETGSVLVTDLCAKLNCSDQTIRRDLREMDESGKLKRVHGGAYLPEMEDKGAPIQLRAMLIPDEKKHIGSIAISLFVKDGDCLMIDSSTTCFMMAQEIVKRRLRVTIITNSLKIINIFDAAASPVKLIGIGGIYEEHSGAFMGAETVRSLSGYLSDKAFISCNAITKEYGLLDNYDRQKIVRQIMISRAKERYLLVDHTKFDDKGRFIIGDCSILDGIVTDKKPSAKWMSFFNDKNVKVYW